MKSTTTKHNHCIQFTLVELVKSHHSKLSNIVYFLTASGHSLENWQQGNYHDAAIPSFPAQIQIENVPTGPAQQCVNADIQKANQSTLTLTVLNSTPTDDSTQPVSFSFGQSSTLVDHDYCMYSTSEYSRADNYHKAVDNRGFMRVEQVICNIIVSILLLLETTSAMLVYTITKNAFPTSNCNAHPDSSI